MPVDTAKVTDRRPLRFNSIADIRRDLTALEAGHRAGTLRTTGNWTAGQNLAHLAAFISYAYDGYPPELRQTPLWIRLILRVMKKRFLYKTLPVGVKIPGIKAGTTGQDDVPFEEGLTRLRSALARLEAAHPDRPNPIFGVMTHPEWMSMHCRHCELHLSFVHPK
jgi:hypothetical protein